MKKNVELFACHLLKNTSVRWGDIKDFDVKTFSIYLMALVQYWKFKTLKIEREETEIADKVYSILYYYSHAKFYNFISISEVRVLILMIRERYNMKDFINLISSSNTIIYEAHIHSTMKIVQKN